MCSGSVAAVIVHYLQSQIAQDCALVKIPIEYVTSRSRCGNTLRNVSRQEQCNSDQHNMMQQSVQLIYMRAMFVG